MGKMTCLRRSHNPTGRIVGRKEKRAVSKLTNTKWKPGREVEKYLKGLLSSHQVNALITTLESHLFLWLWNLAFLSSWGQDFSERGGWCSTSAQLTAKQSRQWCSLLWPQSRVAHFRPMWPLYVGIDPCILGSGPKGPVPPLVGSAHQNWALSCLHPSHVPGLRSAGLPRDLADETALAAESGPWAKG